MLWEKTALNFLESNHKLCFDQNIVSSVQHFERTQYAYVIYSDMESTKTDCPVLVLLHNCVEKTIKPLLRVFSLRWAENKNHTWHLFLNPIATAGQNVFISSYFNFWTGTSWKQTGCNNWKVERLRLYTHICNQPTQTELIQLLSKLYKDLQRKKEYEKLRLTKTRDQAVQTDTRYDVQKTAKPSSGSTACV